MMGWTDRHARYFYRLLSRHTVLYTEMVKDAALLHNQQYIGEQRRLLAHDASEYPLAIQLGGNDPVSLRRCALMAEDAGFSEVNLNVGCPSDRVQSGAFGACLMATPGIVAECVDAMLQAVSIPVTVKCRVGIDDMDGYDAMLDFIDTVAATGCDTFIVHARKAWLQGLSPKDNREVPPLNYDYVYRLKKERPGLDITINGGIKTLGAMHEHLSRVNGVMIGREAYYNPYLLATVDNEFFLQNREASSGAGAAGTAGGDQLVEAPAITPAKTPVKSVANSVVKTRKQVVTEMLPYIERQMSRGASLHSISRHMLGLFTGCHGARAWRRTMSEETHRLPDGDIAAGLALVEKAMSRVTEPDAIPDSGPGQSGEKDQADRAGSFTDQGCADSTVNAG